MEDLERLMAREVVPQVPDSDCFGRTLFALYFSFFFPYKSLGVLTELFSCLFYTSVVTVSCNTALIPLV